MSIKRYTLDYDNGGESHDGEPSCDMYEDAGGDWCRFADVDVLTRHCDEWERLQCLAAKVNLSLCDSNQNLRQHLGALVEAVKNLFTSPMHLEARFPTEAARIASHYRDELQRAVDRAEGYMLGKNEAQP